MKKKAKIITIIVSILIVFAIILLVRNNFFSVVGEFGWIPFSTDSNSFTNPSFNTTHPKDNTDIWTFSSKYWNASTTLTSQYQHTYYPTSGDNNFIVQSSCDNGYNTQCTFLGGFQFNENLQDKSFSIDYKTTGLPYYPNNPNIISVFGYTLPYQSSGKIELKKSVIYRNQSYLFINGQQVQVLDASKPIYLTGAVGSVKNSVLTLTLSNPRYKPLFDCFIDNNEVLAFDEFSAGSKIDITSLSYPVKKFCIDNPPIIRSTTSRGLTSDANGQLLITLSEGGSYTVNSGETVRIYYVTPDTNATIRCALNQAFSTKSNSCVDITSEGLGDSGVNVTAIEVGENQIYYSQKFDSTPLVIGDTEVSASKPIFTCSCDSPLIYAPNPQSSCWSSSINGQSLNTGDTYKLNDYISINYQTIGAVGNKNLCNFAHDDSWTNVLLVNIDKKGLTIAKDPNVDYSTATDLRFVINNNLGNFDSSSAGVKVKTTYLLIDRINEETKDIDLPIGQTSVIIPLEKEVLGRAAVEVVPYVKINGKTIYGSSALSANYNVSKVDTITVTKIIPETITVTNTVIPNYLLYIIIGLAVLVIVLIIYLWRRR